MAKKQTRRAGKPPSKPSKGAGEGEASTRAGVPPESGFTAQEIFTMATRASLSSPITSAEREVMVNELLRAIEEDSLRAAGESDSPSDCIEEQGRRVAMLEEKVHSMGKTLAQLRVHLYRALRSPSLPDTRGEIAAMLRRAPNAWHIRTIAEACIEVLLYHSRREERQAAALSCLGEITRLFRTDLDLRAKCSRQLREAMAHPAFVEAVNRQPKRTRGGTDGNDSIEAILIWTEFVLTDYDKWRNPDMLPMIYAGGDEYMRGFLPYAKEQWEKEDGPRSAEKWMGKKIRTNSGDPKTTKQSFGFFKKEIEKNARRLITAWLERCAPHLRHRGSDEISS